MELKGLKKEVEFEEAKKALSLYKQGYNLREVSEIMSKTRKISHETVRTRINSLIHTPKELTGLDKISE